jgi:FAD/FMN-containing dehydrogenase
MFECGTMEGCHMALTRRAVLAGAGAAAGVAGARWMGATSPSLDGVAIITPKGGETTLNDASLLSETSISKHIIVKEPPGDALVAALRAELKAAEAAGRSVNLAAARHSMGGQAIPRDGHAITFDAPFVQAEPGAETYSVQAGTRWHQVIAALDPLGLSPKVMQSNADFGVASTFSVGAHGWPMPFGPMGSTVRSLQMVLADGSLVTASRTENADLFSAAMGGYGLIGLITELEVEAVPNQLLEPSFRTLPAADFAAAFTTAADGTIPMAYGRLNIDREGFFDDAMLVTYRPVEGEIPPASGSGILSRVSRAIFRAQPGNEWVKRRRWGIETGIGAMLAGATSRSSLMNEPVNTLDDRDPTRTDILHEYFVAPDRFGDFLTAARAIIPGSYQELLNITLRYVARDSTALLSYAPEGARIASVLLFSQEMTARGEADMARMTREMIDAVLAIGGSYYLPYRLHATPDQFARCYTRAPDFGALKRQIDPGLRLRNALWDIYMGQL